MNTHSPKSPGDEEAAIRDEGARWVVRQDRRLTPAEAAALEAWLAAGPRHAAAFEQSSASWRNFRAISLAVRRAPEAAPVAKPRRNWMVPAGLAAAAVFAGALFLAPRRERPPADDGRYGMVTLPAVPVTRRLPDGSVARLKAGAEIAEAFTPAERRVRLVRGEAFFAVEKDAARPFLVEVGDVTVRAVGTAFSVNFEAQAVDVWVAEGTVRVTPPAPASTEPQRDGAGAALVDAGQRGLVAPGSAQQAAAVAVSAVSADELARRLAWNQPMLELAGARLDQVVATFAKQASRPIEIDDATLGAVRIGGRFPIEDLDGFLHALDEIYEVKSARGPDGTILLTKRGSRAR